MNAETENHKEQRDTGAHKAWGKKEKMAQERHKEYVEKRNMQDKEQKQQRVASIRKGEMSNQQGEWVTEFTKRKGREAGIARNEHKAHITQEAQREQ